MDKETIKTFSYRISQSSKSELVVVMFDMAIQYIGDAKLNFDVDMEQYFENVKNAKRVVDELIRSLDMQYDISNHLFKMYCAVSKCLVKALASRKASELDKALDMLVPLRKAFYEVSRTDTSGPVMSNTQQVYAGLTYSSTGTSTETVAGERDTKRGFLI